MKKVSLYMDTSVLGGLFDIEDKKRVDTADSLIKLIKNEIFEGFISFLTLEEMVKAPYEIREKLRNTVTE